MTEQAIEAGAEALYAYPTPLADLTYREVSEIVLRGAGPQLSDGFHTFTELYRHRMLLTAALFGFWAVHDPYGPDHHDVHKSRLHSDGEAPFGGGWFIVVAQLPTGQISYHYPLSDWGMFDIPERERAAEFDGHTPEQVLDRLENFLKT